MMADRTYTIPLRKGYINTASHKKSKKAITTLRSFLQRHTKREDVRIGMHLNEHIWKHGIKNPPPRVKVDVWIDKEFAKAELSGMEYKEAVKPKKKEEEGLKDKLAKKIGYDKDAAGKEKAEQVTKKAAKEMTEKAVQEKKETEKPVKEEKKQPEAETQKPEKPSVSKKEMTAKVAPKRQKKQVKKTVEKLQAP